MLGPSTRGSPSPWPSPKPSTTAPARGRKWWSGARGQMERSARRTTPYGDRSDLSRGRGQRHYLWWLCRRGDLRRLGSQLACLPWLLRCWRPPTTLWTPVLSPSSLSELSRRRWRLRRRWCRGWRRTVTWCSSRDGARCSLTMALSGLQEATCSSPGTAVATPPSSSWTSSGRSCAAAMSCTARLLFSPAGRSDGGRRCAQTTSLWMPRTALRV